MSLVRLPMITVVADSQAGACLEPPTGPWVPTLGPQRCGQHPLPDCVTLEEGLLGFGLALKEQECFKHILGTAMLHPCNLLQSSTVGRVSSAMFYKNMFLEDLHGKALIELMT